MKIPARIAIVLSVLVALGCFGFAYQGFSSLGGIPDPTQHGDAKGFAFFWTFLGVVILGIAVLSWWITATEKE